jgi:hypothetical protein
MPRSELNPAEQEHVRALLRMLRHLRAGRGERHDRVPVARLLDATISQVLTGQALPPGTCRHCGHSNEPVS